MADRGPEVRSLKRCPHCNGAIPEPRPSQRDDALPALHEWRQTLRSRGHRIHPGDLVDADGAALILNRARATLANMRCRGVGPRWVRAGIPGARIGYRLGDLYDWAAGHHE